MGLVGIESPEGPGDRSVESGVQRLGNGYRAARQHPHVLGTRAPAPRTVHTTQRVLHLAAQLQPIRIAFQITEINMM